jgi:nucleotide-binding universal stress UspA family protein
LLATGRAPDGPRLLRFYNGFCLQRDRSVTVTEPFHLLSVAPSQLEYTPIEYKKHAEAYAEKVLNRVSAAAKLAGVVCEVLHVEHEQIFQAIIDATSARNCDLIV